ncbi:MAG: hypothetical protein AAF623_07510 [Planctomycetota bacterium]
MPVFFDNGTNRSEWDGFSNLQMRGNPIDRQHHDLNDDCWHDVQFGQLGQPSELVTAVMAPQSSGIVSLVF